jgi:hypothetical protein
LLPGEPAGDAEFFLLMEKAEAAVMSLHAGNPSLTNPLPRSLAFIRRSPQDRLLQTSYNGVEYSLAQTNMAQAELYSLLATQKQRWTIFVYHHLYDNPSEIPHQVTGKDVDRLFTQKSAFEQQVRLFRNSGYWIAPETEVFKYVKEKKESDVKSERYQNMIFLEVRNQLDPDKFDMPLTIEFKTDASIIRLQGSESDGTYSVRNGSVLFNALPNKEIVVEIIE